MVIEVTFDVTDVYISTTVSPVYVNVSFEAPSGGGGTEWGDITGTLSNQTDLQTALDGKFDDPTGTSLQYIDGTGALQTFPLTLPVLQEVRNQTGATLDAGTVVYINGATGNKPTVTKAIATGDATSAQTLGMVSAAIANNGTGYVVVIGTCSGLDTSAFTEGQQLYLSGTTAGAVTTTKPYAPIHLVYVGIVTRSHPSLGTIEVRVQNGYELDEIHDVDALNPNNNDGLFYNSSTSLWEHKQIGTALGYTPANSATTLTINGVTYDLSANRTWSVGSVNGSGASGQVAYWDGTTSQAGSNNLFWDNTNGRLGIGTNTPITALHVVRNDNSFNQQLIIDNPNSGANAISYFTMRLNSVSGGGVAYYGANYTNVSQRNSLIFYSNDGVKLGFIANAVGTGANQDIYFATKLNNTNLTLFSTGNLLLQNGGTHTDSGQRLQVQGTTLLNGNVTFSSSTEMFWDATNSRLGIGTTAGTGNLLHVAGNTFSNTVTTNGGINLNRNGDEANLIFQRDGTPTAQLRALNGGGFRITGAAAGTEWARFHSTGNFGINTGSSDSGERLQVTGTMKVTGNVSVDTNTLFVDTSNKRIGVRTATPGAPIDVWNSAAAENAQYRISDSRVAIPNYSGVGFSPALTSNTLGFFATSSSSTGGVQFAGFTNTTATASPFIFVGYHGSTAPTVGAMRFLGFKHDGSTGRTALTGSEIIAGFAAGTGADVFQVKANGRINMSSLPTSSTGLATGDLWNDAGTLKIV